MPVYDSYSAVRRLMETGISEEQAVAIVREQFTFAENLATKDDLVRLREEVAAVIKAEVAQLRLEREASESRIIRYIIGVAVGISGMVVAMSGSVVAFLKWL